MPTSLAFTLGGIVTPQLVRVFKPRYVIAGGLLLASYGFYMMTFVEISHAFVPFMWGLVVYSLGISPIFTLSTDLIVSAVSPERAGSAASLSETSTELGGALGMAILGSLGTAVYRAEISSTLADSIPSAMINTIRSTLGAALGMSRLLPNDQGTMVMLTAKQAFLDAMRHVCHINIGIVVVLAVVALIFVHQKERL
jgi:DHA2 family multidrug resistance protein-like MFS transporter